MSTYVIISCCLNEMIISISIYGLFSLFFYFFLCFFFLFFFFFFSSRRRHTRSLRDWSSDVCSSDLRKIAAHLLEASEADVEFKNGQFTVAGTDRSKAFAEIALTAYVPHNFPHEELDPGLDESAFYDPKNFTFPSGAHIAEIEIDPDIGSIEIVKFTASDDFGRIINPMIVAGQVPA